MCILRIAHGVLIDSILGTSVLPSLLVCFCMFLDPLHARQVSPFHSARVTRPGSPHQPIGRPSLALLARPAALADLFPFCIPSRTSLSLFRAAHGHTSQQYAQLTELAWPFRLGYRGPAKRNPALSHTRATCTAYSLPICREQRETKRDLSMPPNGWHTDVQVYRPYA